MSHRFIGVRLYNKGFSSVIIKVEQTYCFQQQMLNADRININE